jgi:hypothetical protein
MFARKWSEAQPADDKVLSLRDGDTHLSIFSF